MKSERQVYGAPPSEYLDSSGGLLCRWVESESEVDRISRKWTFRIILLKWSECYFYFLRILSRNLRFKEKEQKEYTSSKVSFKN